MKNIYIVIALVFGLFAAGCSSSQYSQNQGYDDVYYSDRDYDMMNSLRIRINYKQNPILKKFLDLKILLTTESYTDRNGDTYVTNNYYDDYYDYSYSSRIRRFYHPQSSFSYYNSYYTNSYWYNYNPHSWGVSIYLGYNWWNPHPYHYNPYWGSGYYSNFGYSPFNYYWHNPITVHHRITPLMEDMAMVITTDIIMDTIMAIMMAITVLLIIIIVMMEVAMCFMAMVLLSSNTPDYPKTPRTLGNIYEASNTGKPAPTYNNTPAS